MQKVKFLALALAVALVLTGISYAAWSENLLGGSTVHTGEVDWCFSLCGISLDQGQDWVCYNDNFLNPASAGKDVGKTECTLLDTDGDEDNDALKVTITNAYPGYYNMVFFTAHNNGTVPVTIQEPEVSTSDPDAIQVAWADHVGATLQPGPFPVSLSFHFRVTDSAEQGATYTFTISIPAVQWNMAQ